MLTVIRVSKGRRRNGERRKEVDFCKGLSTSGTGIGCGHHDRLFV